MLQVAFQSGVSGHNGSISVQVREEFSGQSSFVLAASYRGVTAGLVGRLGSWSALSEGIVDVIS